MTSGASEPPSLPAAPEVPCGLVPAPDDLGELVQRARADGFVFLPGLLAPALVEPLAALVDRALARRGWARQESHSRSWRTDPALRLGRWDDPRWIGFLGEVLPSPPCRTLAGGPGLTRVLEAILGSPPALHAGDVCRLVSPGAPELTTPPHQDAAYLRDAGQVWTAWTPLGPCPRELGPLALLAGSHRGGLLPHLPVRAGGPVVGLEVPADAPWLSADLWPGDVLLFSALTVHCALPNRTADRLRVSVDYRYRPGPPRP